MLSNKSLALDLASGSENVVRRSIGVKNERNNKSFP